MNSILKKVTSLVLICTFLFGNLISSTTYATGTDSEANQESMAIVFYDTYKKDNQFLGKYQEQINSKLIKYSIDNDRISLNLVLDKYGEIKISGDISDGLIENLVVMSTQINVENILVSGKYLSIVLRDNDDYITLGFETPKTSELLRYNPYWYSKLVEKPVEKDIIENNSNNYLTSGSIKTQDIYRNISRQFVVLGDQYNESIRLKIRYSSPSYITGLGSEDFFSSLTLDSRKTVIQFLHGGSTSYNDSSLFVSGATYEIATDTGEYIRDVSTYGEFTKHNNDTKISLNFGLAIPSTPFGIAYNYNSGTERISSNGQFNNFHRNTDAQFVQLKMNWDAREYTLDVDNDYFEGGVRLATSSTYAAHGRKGLVTKWKFIINNKLSNNGVAVPSYSKDVMQSHTMFYNY